MPFEVVNQDGKRSSFAVDRLTGALVRMGLPSTDALAYAEATEKYLVTSDETIVSTDALRMLVTELVGSRPHNLAVASILRRHPIKDRTSVPHSVGPQPHSAEVNRCLHMMPSGVFPVPSPAFVDLPPQPGPFVVKHDSTPGILIGPSFTAEQLDRALQSAIGYGGVQERLAGKKYASIDVHFVREPSSPKRGHDLARVVVYNYTDDLALEVEIDPLNLEVKSINETRSQPPLSSEELDRAIRLASRNQQVAVWLSSGLVAKSILITQEGTGPHRTVLVLISESEDRNARYWCVVDLSAEAITEIGQVREDRA
jgi:hypothetical protein